MSIRIKDLATTTSIDNNDYFILDKTDETYKTTYDTLSSSILTQENIQSQISDKSAFLTNIGAVSSNGAGANPVSFRESIYVNHYVDIRDYGAVAGINVSESIRTANTQAIQAAMDSGKNVWIPIGRWEINGQLYSRVSGQTIRGESATRSVIDQTSADYGHFILQANDATNFPNNPPGGSAGTSAHVTIEHIFINSTVPNANAGIMVELPPDGPGQPYTNGLTWLEDNLRCRDLWIQGYSAPGGRGIDLYSSAKIFMDRILTKSCDIGVKVYGGSSNCQQWHGFSFNECRIGFWGESLTGSLITVSDTSTGTVQSGAPVQEANFKLVDCQVTIIGGEIEFNDNDASKNALFVDAEGGRIDLQNQRFLSSSLTTNPPILARAVRTIPTATNSVGQAVYTHIQLTNLRRDSLPLGMPIATSGGNTAFITSSNNGDFLSSDLANNVLAGAWQRLAWSGGTKQVETATAAGTIINSGDAKITITSDKLYSSPLTFYVPVTAGNTASTWATAVRASLSADYQIRRVYTVGGTSTSITLTETIWGANDNSLNIALENGTCTGITTALNSTTTVPGVSSEIVRIGILPWLDPSTSTTPTANMEGVLFQTPGSGTTNSWGGGIRSVVRDYAANPGTNTAYRYVDLTRQNMFVLNRNNALGHFGQPDLILLDSATPFETPLNATTHPGYKAALRGGIIITYRNKSAVTHTIKPNGSDTIDGASGSINITAGQTIRLFTVGNGDWLTL